MPRFHILLPILALGCAPLLFAADCASLKQVKLTDTTIASADAIPAGAFPGQDGKPMKDLPAFCRVTGTLRPTADSVIRFEVWLPEAAAWNGRLLGAGNGGFAGSIGYLSLASSVAHGYAAAGSDAGHQAEAEDASWAYKHPEKIKDFGWRAVHLTALRSKEILAAYYGKPQTKAYFDSCSDGGREALMEAQRFPEDYDGILAGAPANNWSHMLAGGLALSQETTGQPEAYISSMKLPAIQKAALMACDAQDGVKDGIVSDPANCHFDPALLLCKGEESTSCLTAPQVNSLKALYRGGADAHGNVVFTGLIPGDEYPGWQSWVLGNAPGGASGNNYMNGFFRYMVYSDPKWYSLTADVDKALETTLAGPGKEIDATDADLRKFAARGGKLVIYHGWNDPAISPWNSIRYVEDVHKTMGAENAESTVRLYMAPGMEHCIGGPGPNVFGQLGLPAAGGPGTGMLDALQTWVEQGKRPESILAVKQGGTKEQPEVTVRPLCPWPEQAKYNGSGDPKQPGSFSCSK